MPRYLIRPRSFLTTPRALHRLFRTQRTVAYNGRNRIQPDWSKDFFLSYRFPPEQVLSSDENYLELHLFYRSNKCRQRELLAETGIKVPNDYPSSKYVVRPLRHYAGSNYRVTEDDNDFDSQHEYLSHLFPKTSEYRAIYSKGTLVCLLKKFVPPDISPELPWNHANGSFFTTVVLETANLRKTTFVEDALRSPVIQSAHLLAVDILYRNTRSYPYNYAVCEVNFCPSLTIPANLETLKDYVYSTFETA